jgi:hypothetical protein
LNYKSTLICPQKKPIAIKTIGFLTLKIVDT